MNTIKLIENTRQIHPDIDIYYFGWNDSEIEKYKNNYQGNFLGGDRDAKLEIFDGLGKHFYAIFKGYPECGGSELDLQNKKIDYLVFKDGNRVLLNVFGKLYRFLIDEKLSLSTEQFDSFFKSVMYPNSYIPSLSSSEYELMVFAESQIIAISWDKICWKYTQDNADIYDFELLSIDNNILRIHHRNHLLIGEEIMCFNVQTGDLIKCSAVI
jgi:hypothetical protein